MTNFKVGDRVRRVRNNSTMQIIEFIHHPVGAEFTVDSLGAVLVASADGRYCPISDCELVEEAKGWRISDCCKMCGQKLQPKPKTIPFPAHEIPAPLDVEPEKMTPVFCALIQEPGYYYYTPYNPVHKKWFNDGLLYATEAEAQARYEAIVAPTRREEG